MTMFYDFIARDKDGALHLFVGRPHRKICWWVESNEYSDYNDVPEPIEVPRDYFPELTWESEPIEIEIRRRAM